MALIEKIKLHNFKRFQQFYTKLDNTLNVFIGDNESGKSTLLLALDIVLSGSRTKVEAIGLENLFSSKAISTFLASAKKYSDLPTLFIELYLNEQNDPELNGKNNSEGIECDGIQLLCEPIDRLSEEIKKILQQDSPSFPFEYYETSFLTFSGKPYAGYNKPVRHIFIDSSLINNDYATREYIRDLYNTNVEGTEKNKHQNEYRNYKERFRNDVLNDLNDRLEKYSFTIRSTGKSNLETDLTIAEAGIPIENRGKGQQCIIKTEFALNKPKRQTNIDILLLEEPENHLSHVNMRKLVQRILETTGKQLFIATHSNLISARLNLKKCVLLNSNTTDIALLDSLPVDTADFFMKAPDNNILEFILSKKVILVEGDAEYILAAAFFEKETGQTLESADVHVISVDGTSFKRYLDLARLLKIRTAVIRDNDHNFAQNCVERYTDYVNDHIRIFADGNDDMYTFEISFYASNSAICDELFSKGRRTLSVKEYMVKNKTDAALALLINKANDMIIPQYFLEAIQWIKQ